MRWLILLALPLSILSRSVKEYVWHITSFIDAPDGYARRVVGINGRPGSESPIQVTLGDTIHVTAINDLTEPATIHWHGISQNHTVFSDGTAGVTQCAIPPGGTFVYQFTPSLPGTYWWHSHYKDQYLDGLRGSLVVLDPKDPYKDLYDEDIVVLLGDWYHNQSATLFASYSNPNSYLHTSEPMWSSGLINGRGQYDCSRVEKTDPFISCTYQPLTTFKFAYGKSYRLRVINSAGFASFNFTIAGHAMSVIEADSVYVTPTPLVTSIFINTGQRYSVIVKADQKPAQYIMEGYMNHGVPYEWMPPSEFDTGDTNLAWAIVKYEGRHRDVEAPSYGLVYLEQSMLIPLTGMVPQYSNQTVEFAFNFYETATEPEDYARVTLNNASVAYAYMSPEIPTLFDVVYNGKNASNLPVNSNAVDLNYMDVIDLVVLNYDFGEHPFHMHGHTFWIIGEGNSNNITDIPNHYNLVNPVKRDTVSVWPCFTDAAGNSIPGYVVLRFVADNPGVWFFHCHMDWHLAMGLAMVLVEAPDVLRDQYTIVPQCCLNQVLDGLDGYYDLAVVLMPSIYLALSL